MIEDIKKFEFWFGNPFCGIKKMLIIFGENFSVHSNGHNKKNNLIETEILKKIKSLQEKHNGRKKSLGHTHNG